MGDPFQGIGTALGDFGRIAFSAAVTLLALVTLWAATIRILRERYETRLRRRIVLAQQERAVAAHAAAGLPVAAPAPVRRLRRAA